MPFIIAARRELANLNPGTPNHSILDFLINNALGAVNAKSWDAIEAHCNQNQVVVDKQAFQQGFLAETRDGDIFIGSCSRGYFIIQDRGDAIVAADFYRVRIAREQQHVAHLGNLVIQQGWPAI
jgi:hypothetical protein